MTLNPAQSRPCRARSQRVPRQFPEGSILLFEDGDAAGQGTLFAEADHPGRPTREHAGMADDPTENAHSIVEQGNLAFLLFLIERSQLPSHLPGRVAGLLHAETDENVIGAAQIPVQDPQQGPNPGQFRLDFFH